MTSDPGAPEFSTRPLVRRSRAPLFGAVTRAGAAVNAALDFYLTPNVKFLALVSVATFLALRAARWLGPDSAPAFIDRFLALNGHYSLFFIWEFVTHLFLHTGMGHLLIDLFILVLIGPELETRWGGSRFLRFFLSVGVGGALLHHFMAFVFGAPVYPVMGFTGVLFGMVLAYVAYFPSRRFLVFHAVPLPVSWVMPAAMLAGAMLLPRLDDHVSNLLNAACLVMSLVYLADYHRTWNVRIWRYLR